MGGVARNEGPTLSSPEAQHLKSEEEFKNLIKTQKLFPELDSEKISKFYLKGVDTNSTEALKKAFWDFFGDVYIACPAFHFVKAFSEYTPKRNAFFFYWTYLSVEMRRLMGCREDMGVCHGADIRYVFGRPLLLNLNLTDRQFSEQIMKIWTNLAKNG